AVLFPILAIALILVRMLRRAGTRVWTATRGRPLRRCLAGLLALALVAALGFLWWPREGTYRPIQPYEGGTLTQVASAARPPTAGLRPGDHRQLTTAWADGDPRPTREEPQLALVLVPRTGSGADPESSSGSTDTGAGTGAAGRTPEAWVFPFNKPLEPGKGDNQALAVNTGDNTIRYDVAFALVWVEDDLPALNRNEAYAFASCTHCAAVSIGFQVVLVTGDNHVAVPQNISAAVNYDCVNCLTYALATQLFVTLDGPLGEASTQQLAQLWSEIAEFGRNIATVPLSEIQDRLTAYETKILDIIGSGAQQAGRDGSVEAGDPGNEEAPSQGPSPAAEPGTAPADEPTVDETTPEPGDATATDPGTRIGAETGAGADAGTGEPSTAEPTPASEPSANP
ncbi:MAG: hypothetical protein JWP24_2723, partial [Marmoricola sp.]|nr:hypothetical protein [Marmoricola sp.]